MFDIAFWHMVIPHGHFPNTYGVTNTIRQTEVKHLRWLKTPYGKHTYKNVGENVPTRATYMNMCEGVCPLSFVTPSIRMVEIIVINNRRDAIL